MCRIEWHLIFRRHNRRQNNIQKVTLLLILVFWWPPCSHFFPGWVLGKIMHVPTPYSTSITALYVNRNFIVSSYSSDFIDICSKIKQPSACFIPFHAPGSLLLIARCTLKTELWLQSKSPELSCALIENLIGHYSRPQLQQGAIKREFLCFHYAPEQHNSMQSALYGQQQVCLIMNTLTYINGSAA